MTTKAFSQADLAHFVGSKQWYRHGIVRDVAPAGGPGGRPRCRTRSTGIG
jgi:hypothetical protein